MEIEEAFSFGCLNARLGSFMTVHPEFRIPGRKREARNGMELVDKVPMAPQLMPRDTPPVLGAETGLICNVPVDCSVYNAVGRVAGDQLNVDCALTTITTVAGTT